MPRIRPATAITVAGLFLLSGCTFLRGAGEVAREVGNGALAVVTIATAPIWLPAYAVAMSQRCPPRMLGVGMGPPARTDVSTFSVSRLPPLPSPAGLSDPAAFRLHGPNGILSPGADLSTVIVRRRNVSTVVRLPVTPSDRPAWQHFEYAPANEERCPDDLFFLYPDFGFRQPDGSEIQPQDPPLAFGPPPRTLASDASITLLAAPTRFAGLPQFEPRHMQGRWLLPGPYRVIGRLPDGAWVAMTDSNEPNDAAMRWQRTVRVIAGSDPRDFALPVEAGATVSAQVLSDGTMLIAEAVGPDNSRSWLLRRAQIPSDLMGGVFATAPRITITPTAFPGLALQDVVAQPEPDGRLRLYLNLRPRALAPGETTIIATYRM